MKKQSWLVGLFIVLSGLGINVQAATSKVGIVDLAKIMAQAKQGNEIKAKLAKEFEPRKKSLMSFQDSIKADIEKLQRDDAIMTDAQKTALQQKIMTDRKAFEEKGQAYQKELTAAHNKAMQLFFGDVKKVVDVIAKSGKYDMILQKEGVFYSASNMDITSQVVAKL